MINRQRFLRNVAYSAVAAGGTVWLATSQQTATADTPTESMLVGTLEQAINVRAATCDAPGDACVSPRLLMNGTYALPESLLRSTQSAMATELLSKWTAGGVTVSDYRSTEEFGDDQQFVFQVDQKLVRHAGRPSSLTMPSPGLFRFEVRGNDFAGPYDAKNGNRRSEIVSSQRNGVGSGTIWTSFGLVLGGIPALAGSSNAIVHQWHSSDIGIGRSPVLFVDIAGDELKLCTCSSALLYGTSATGKRPPEDGVPVIQYRSGLPAEGDMTHFVIQATFGEYGHLKVWLDGNPIVDVDTPIGYFTDLNDGSGRSILGYPHWGLYTTNQMETDVIYIANPEWGPSDLSTRIDHPLSI